uniref:Uncharacterized protein n=1 Tax=Panagrolaimus davidi TaxID=227884 RepID=A0A914Q0W9_9BILA
MATTIQECASSSAAERRRKRKLDATQEETINTTAEIDFVEPSYMDLIDINRVQACVIAGAMLRILTFFHVIHSVSPIWIPLSLAYHTCSLIQVEKKFPKHGYIVNFLLVGGMSEKLVRYLGLGIDTLWSFAMDSLIMAFGFLCVHIGFMIYYCIMTVS